MFLLDQFALYLAHDWHWFRLRTFRQRLENTYKKANSTESKDRMWLCQLLVVLALAESVNDAGRRPEITLDLASDGAQSFGLCPTVPVSVSPPGGEFFEQALRLLKIPFENASISHIEALNLIVCALSYPPFVNLIQSRYYIRTSSIDKRPPTCMPELAPGSATCFNCIEPQPPRTARLLNANTGSVFGGLRTVWTE